MTFSDLASMLYSHPNIPCMQHMLLVRFTHQSMLITMTLSPELRVTVPTVGDIQKIMFKEVYIQNTTSIVMEQNSN